MRSLRPKQQRFCEEYIIDLNATQAAIRAGYSKKTATIIGFENLTKPNISKYISKIRQEILERNKITVDGIVKRIDDVANESEDDNTKLKALDMLMKHTGGYEKDNKMTVSYESEILKDL